MTSSSSNVNFLPLSRYYNINDPVQLQRALSKETEDVANAVNSRTCGIFSQTQTPIGDTFFFSAESVSRVAVLALSLPIGTTTVQTEIAFSPQLRLVRLYGVANSSTQCVPLPAVNTANISDSIGLSFDPVSGQVSISTTTNGWSSFSAVVVVEFLYLS